MLACILGCICGMFECFIAACWVGQSFVDSQICFLWCCLDGFLCMYASIGVYYPTSIQLGLHGYQYVYTKRGVMCGLSSRPTYLS